MNNQTTTSYRQARPQARAARPEVPSVDHVTLVNSLAAALGHAGALSAEEARATHSFGEWWTKFRSTFFRVGDDNAYAMWDFCHRGRGGVEEVRWTTTYHRLTVTGRTSYTHRPYVKFDFWAGGNDPQVFLRLRIEFGPWNGRGTPEYRVAVPIWKPELLAGRPDRIVLLNMLLKRSPELWEALGATTYDLTYDEREINEERLLDVLWTLDAAVDRVHFEKQIKDEIWQAEEYQRHCENLTKA